VPLLLIWPPKKSDHIVPPSSYLWWLPIDDSLFLGKISTVSGHVSERECESGGLQEHHGGLCQVSTAPHGGSLVPGPCERADESDCALGGSCT
jgi:hypothetical protein